MFFFFHRWYKQLYKDTFGESEGAPDEEAVEAADDETLDGGRE